MSQIRQGMHAYLQANRSFPPAASSSGLSWRVLILPHIGEAALFQQFNLKEPWDGPTNQKLLEKMPAVYVPVGATQAPPNTTYYQVFVGPGTVFEAAGPDQGQKLTNIYDGTKNTILLVEGGEPVPWTKPQDLPYDPAQPLPKLGGLFSDRINAATVEGDILALKPEAQEAHLRRLITRAGGEKFVDPYEFTIK